MKALCMIFGHRVNRKRVRRAGHSYIGKCRWCETRMERLPEGWDVASDEDDWNQDLAAGSRG